MTANINDGLTDYIERAALMARAMTQRESQGTGDTDSAMRRVSRRFRVPYRLLWALRYKPPKGIFYDVYNRLCEAYEADCRQHLLKLQNELTETRNAVDPRIQLCPDLFNAKTMREICSWQVSTGHMGQNDTHAKRGARYA